MQVTCNIHVCVPFRLPRKCRIKTVNISLDNGTISCKPMSWWPHGMETFSILLALCARSSIPYRHVCIYTECWPCAAFIYTFHFDYRKCARDMFFLAKGSFHVNVIQYATEQKCWYSSGLILGLRPANERRRSFVTTSLIGSAQA